MKKYKNLIEKIASYDNILISIKEVIRGNKKRSYLSSQEILNNLEFYCRKIHNDLMSGTFTPSGYREFSIIEGKKTRIIQSLSMYDRIVLHAIMNILGGVEFKMSFITDTYASIKGRGVLNGVNRLRKFLKDINGTKYCLKIDLKKFYNSINQGILINLLNNRIDDKPLMRILTSIIRSFPDGLPIGYHSSQYLGNFYLSEFDHYMKSVIKVKYYIRYCDDIVILSSNKEYLWRILSIMKDYLEGRLNLKIKSNYQVFPVESRGIDFLGYVNKHGRTKIRKGIKVKALRKLSKVSSIDRTREILASINGWLSNCDETPKINISKIIKYKNLIKIMENFEVNETKKNSIEDEFRQSLSNSQATGLAKKIISFNSVKKFSDLGIKQEPRKRMLNGKKVSTNDIINLPIIITDVVEDVVTGKFEDPSDGVKHVNKTAVEFIYVNDESQYRYKFITSAYLLVNALKEMKDYLPVLVTIRKSSDPSNLGRSYLKFE